MSEVEPRRALVLAGGGLKVAFQAGVLQVWLDEAGIEFEAADGASGGVFNLAMWCAGKSGTEIADAWRRTRPFDFFALNPRPWVAVSSLERFRRKVLPTWGVDWNSIERPNAGFNVYNFSDHVLEVRPPEAMSDDWLLACVSLPGWFPPVEIGGKAYVDAVFATDANLEAAIRSGANQLWVVWTVSSGGRWRSNPLSHYFQILENAAVWRLKDVLARIEASNAAIAERGCGEFAHHVDVKLLCAEVPLHYLFVFNGDRLHEAVELGVERARAWCAEHGVPLRNPPPRSLPDPTHLSFAETMRGEIAFGEDDPRKGAVGQAGSRAGLAVELSVGVGGASRFVVDPQHAARLTGWVSSDALGGRLPVESGVANLFPQEQDLAVRRMLYRLHFRDGVGHPLTLTGEKIVPGPGWHPWYDTTTLFTRVLRGRIDEKDDPSAEVVAAGVVRITPLAFARQLTTFRARGLGRLGGVRLFARFVAFFLGVVARAYLRR